MAKRDYYEVLGVPRDATEAALKTEYRRLAMKYHPDRNQGDDAEPNAEERFKEVKEAYEVLSDSRKRTAYDQFGHAGVSGQPPPRRPNRGFGGAPNFEDIFGGGAAGFHSVRMNISGQFGNSTWVLNHLGNVEVVAMVPIRVLLQGHPAYPVHFPYPVEGNVSGIDRRATVLKIEPDTPIFHQETIEHVLPEGGLLTIQLVPLQDAGFFPDGADIMTEVAIDTLDAIVGGDLTVPHPGGTRMKIKLKPNTRDGMMLKLAGRGLRRKDGSRGDFVVGIAHHTMNYSDNQLDVLRDAIKKIREEMKHG